MIDFATSLGYIEPSLGNVPAYKEIAEMQKKTRVLILSNLAAMACALFAHSAISGIPNTDPIIAAVFKMLIVLVFTLGAHMFQQRVAENAMFVAACTFVGTAFLPISSLETGILSVMATMMCSAALAALALRRFNGNPIKKTIGSFMIVSVAVSAMVVSKNAFEAILSFAICAPFVIVMVFLGHHLHNVHVRKSA